MLTRCPHCRTAFRVTREQLLARDGKVRCGACRRAFNAMGFLEHEENDHKPETAPVPPPPSSPPSSPPAVRETPLEDADTLFLETLFPEEIGADKEEMADWPPAPAAPRTPPPASPLHPPTAPGAIDELLSSSLSSSSPRFPDPIDALLAAEDAQDVPPILEDEDDDELETTASRHASASRWAVAPPPDVAAEAAYPLWPFVLISLLLALLLFFQVVHHYRGELGRQAPVALRLFSAFNINMPLAQEVEWLSIDASELLSRTRPGHFRLNATLRNQSRYPQAWPQLEISLTDSYDNILTRRVFAPAEYLPAAAASAAFAPGETQVTLDLDAGDLNPTGYRLYLFYF
ncbi:MAG: DUF3426 domain-containing protein [Zoogloeaceae bacterium]|jgi:predicted Zn finger-like uncharacterized protein|nr:DUF3426 domain-containing protein [Zoogloeaceae bacterium]